MPIRSARLTQLFWQAALSSLIPYQLRHLDISRGEILLSDKSVETLAFSIYSKEHICTHEYCSCNLKYIINTMMNLELLIIMVVFEHWLFFLNIRRNLLFTDLLTNSHFVS